jgi:hypothetical protein
MRKGSRRNSPKPAEVFEEEEVTEESPEDGDSINVESSSVTVNDLAPAKIESPWRANRDQRLISNEFVARTTPADTRLAVIRDAFNNLGNLIEDSAPPSRHRSVALTNLETASMWAMKAVAIEIAAEKANDGGETASVSDTGAIFKHG